MAEATSITFTPLEMTSGKKRALVTATISSNETITLDDHEYAIDTILKADGQVSATGAALTFAYATNVLTLSTGSITDAAAVIEILYE